MLVECESPGLNPGSALDTAGLECVEDDGIPSVEVKFVDIGKNTGGEGDHLDHN